tara:strand:+ start:133 stop:657 length:525 start_codon:yes stop_codon:yes gene_type:complete
MNKILIALSLTFLFACDNGPSNLEEGSSNPEEDSSNLEGIYYLDLENSQTIIDAKKNIKQLELVRDRGREPDAQARYERRLKGAKDQLELFKITFDSINIDNNYIFKWDNLWCKVIDINVPKGVKCTWGSRERLLEDIANIDRSDNSDMQINKTRNGLKVIAQYGYEFNFILKN